MPAAALEELGEGGLAHAPGLVRARHERPQLEEPVRRHVIGDVQDLRVVAPQLLAHAVAEPGAFLAQILAPAGTRTFGHGEDRDRVITADGRTFVVPAGNRKH